MWVKVNGLKALVEFKDALKRAMDAQGISPYDLAQEVGLSRDDSIYKYLRGEQFPSQETLDRLNRKLKLNYLLPKDQELIDAIVGELNTVESVNKRNVSIEREKLSKPMRKRLLEMGYKIDVLGREFIVRNE